MTEEFPHAVEDDGDVCIYCGLHWSRTGLQDCPDRIHASLKEALEDARLLRRALECAEETLDIASRQIEVMEEEAKESEALVTALSLKAKSAYLDGYEAGKAYICAKF